jgi:heme oxygenase (biliverdin-IX-beta and delta-forming)
MILEQLKAATRPHHEAMERDPLSRSLLAPAISRADYLQVLQVYLGFYAPLEAVLFSRPEWAQLGFATERRHKTPLLLRDLRALGASTTSATDVPHCTDLPPITSLGAALGCMYVLEGATLGGQLIARHLGATLGLTPERGSAFFNSYGAELGPRWKEFRALLEAQAATPAAREQSIATASATFSAMQRWFSLGYRPSTAATAD